MAKFGHELKTPLAIVLGLCSRLEAGGRLSDQDAVDVARIRANAHAMAHHVDDLMLAARIGGGALRFTPALTDVSAIVRRCAEPFAPLAADRAITVDLLLPGRLAACVDADKLGSAATNLLANALRHAPSGGVVRATLRARVSTLVLEVADDGPGVPPGQRDAIFAPFHTVEGRGTGLGLAIVREIAELHGGSVRVGDAPEGGALFTLVLPLRARPTAEAAPAPAPQAAHAAR